MAVFTVVLDNFPLMLVAAVDCAAPPENPVPAGANQVYWVPSGTMPLLVFSGTTLNVTPEQTEIEIG